MRTLAKQLQRKLAAIGKRPAESLEGSGTPWRVRVAQYLRRLRNTVYGLLVLLGTGACGYLHTLPKTPAPAEEELEMIGIPLSLEGSGAFPLSDGVLDFTLKLENCSSGYHATHAFSVGGPALNVYKKDTACTVGLLDFNWDGRTWTKAGGGPFAGPAMAVFENDVDGQTLLLANPDRLSSPVALTDTVSFFFTELSEGDDSQLFVVGNPNFLPGDVGPSAPNLTMGSPDDIALTQIDDSSGVATLDLSLNCGVPITDFAPDPASAVCDASPPNLENHALVDMDVLLVKDDQNGTLTRAQAVSFFDSPPAGTGIVVVAGVNVVAPQGAKNGGFTVSISTPTSIASCGSYLLIIRKYDNDPALRSYTYFNLDLITSSTTCP